MLYIFRMKKLWKYFYYVFSISMLLMDTSTVSGDDVINTLFSPKENELYEKLSSTFAPTALIPLDEPYSHTINQQCIEDSRHYVKALLNQSEWALSSNSIVHILLSKLINTILNSVSGFWKIAI